MPGRPLRPCTYPGCGALTDGKTSRCVKHVETPWKKTGPQVKRITGNTLIRLRKRLFQKEPLCVICLKYGKTRLATQRDHIVPLQEGGKDVESNTQGLCQECHDAKSKVERERGLGRYHQP